jgi:hypothetical protein
VTEKGATVMAVVVIMLLGAAHASYGYWTERIGVKEDFAIVWSVEVEVEEETEEETVKITEDKENVEVTEEMEAATGMESSETELQI